MNIALSPTQLKVVVFIYGLYMSIFKVVLISEPLEVFGRKFCFIEEIIMMLTAKSQEDKDVNQQNRAEASQKNTENNRITMHEQRIILIDKNPVKSALTVSYGSHTLLPIDAPFKPFRQISLSTLSDSILESDLLPHLNSVPMRSNASTVGIVNQGNSCYAICIIQMIFRIPNIRKIIGNLQIYHKRIFIQASKLIRMAERLSKTGYPNEASKFYSKFEDLVKGTQVVEGINHMFYQLQTNDPINKATFTQTSQCLQILPGIFSHNNQEDADEYLMMILDALHSIIPISQRYHFSITILLNQTRTILNSSKTVHKSRIDTLYQFSLPLIEGIETLPELIKSELGSQVYEHQFEFDESIIRFTESKVILNLPDFLPIKLQRLTYDSNGLRKVSRPIRVPEVLDFSPFYHSSNSKSFYKLEMFVEHLGGPYDGHYVSYARNRTTGSWYEFNDEIVRQVPDYSVESKITTAYIYFYRKL